jgi:Fungal specific transcription factor domain/Fungal Zn(2)-Cys(6) binuclear cluster domain
MSTRDYIKKPCHNCRRQRLKCDQSHPQCHRCIRTAQECLGYGKLFRWNKGVASRGKMMGMTFENCRQKQGKQVSPRICSIKKHADAATLDISNTTTYFPLHIAYGLELSRVPRNEIHAAEPTSPAPNCSLLDPLIQDLNQDLRCYLYYCKWLHSCCLWCCLLKRSSLPVARSVCQDLVCYDVPNHNPFRLLIPLTRGYPALLHVIIAISALHMSNASQRPFRKSSFTLAQRKTTSRYGIDSTSFSSTPSSKAYSQALLAKQSALRLLRRILNDTQSADLEIVLASVLLFVEFELIDSGRDDWRFHINAAKGLIDSLQSSCPLRQGNVSRMRSCLVSNCAVYVCVPILTPTKMSCRLTNRLKWIRYDILGSTLAHSIPYEALHTSSTQLLSALESAETNNYLSCPAILLQLVLTATKLSHSIPWDLAMDPTRMTSTPAQQISLLLLTARAFDAVVWAMDLQKFSPHKDAEKRIHIASAHKAAVCIYISRASSLFSQAVDPGDDLEPLVADIVHHLSFVTCDDGLFKATSWPAFIAGVETKDLPSQEWAVKRLYEVWEFCPWGYIQSAVEIIDMIQWKRNNITSRSGTSINWLQELRSLGVDWLIA